mmetsp:Transcript_56563/g.106101  ORF Transcript_56563/g.106101 Transcript_56563/m.106101 type:complete len:386 (+) Transcript_56563:78-1235(+)
MAAEADSLCLTAAAYAARTMTRDANISRGDGNNYFIVESAELEDYELIVSGCVIGDVLDPSLAQVFSLPCSRPWSKNVEVDPEMPHSTGTQVQISFVSNAPVDIFALEDLFFRYAPEYSDVSILKLCLEHRTHVEAQIPMPSWYAGVASSVPRLEDASLPRRHAYPEPADHTGKREIFPAQNGFLQKTIPNKEQGADGGFWPARAAAACAAVEAKHEGVLRLLDARLRTMQVLQKSWLAGDVNELVQTLEAGKDDSLAATCLNRLVLHPRPLAARSLARLLPIVQKLAQADFEEHAVAAVRFTLHSLRVSWPDIAKLLRSVATPRVVLQCCEEAVVRLQSLYSTVKALSRSVKISKTNGPLVPLCKKLKLSLEEALAGAGRLRNQ